MTGGGGGREMYSMYGSVATPTNFLVASTHHSPNHLLVATPTYHRPHPPPCSTTGPTHLSVPLDDGNPLADALRDLMVGHCPLDLCMRTIISVTPYQGRIEPPLAISIYCHGSPNYRRSGNFRL